MKEIALVILYNHQYIENIERVEKLYSSRFTNIFHLMPFYNGSRANVIPVYENSFYFQGYIAQGFKKFWAAEFEHYLFLADDVFLNPKINENNYLAFFDIKFNQSFIPHFIKLHESKEKWGRKSDALSFSIDIAGLEVKNILPTYDEAYERFKHHDLLLDSISHDDLYPPIKFSNITDIGGNFLAGIKPKPNEAFKRSLHSSLMILKNDIERLVKRFRMRYFGSKNERYKLPYPLVGSYSDILIIDKNSINKFSHYCGIFASLNLFVELAIPTALVLSSESIISEDNLKMKGKVLWPDGYSKMDGSGDYSKGDLEWLENFNLSLTNLSENFPTDTLYIHPIKLSKWN